MRLLVDRNNSVVSGSWAWPGFAPIQGESIRGLVADQWVRQGPLRDPYPTVDAQMEKTNELVSARIELTAQGIITVRFREDLKLSNEVLAEVMGNRCRAQAGTHPVIVVIPEHTDYDARIMMVDHYALHGLADKTTALAIVCEEPGLLHLLRLYFAYHPPKFEVKFCDDIIEASAWLMIRALSSSAA